MSRRPIALEGFPIHTVTVHQPVEVVHEEWLRTSSWSRFMDDVEAVSRLSEDLLLWTVKRAGVLRQWRATITEHVPGESLAWATTSEIGHDGRVTFRPVGEGSTEVSLAMRFQPEHVTDELTDETAYLDRRVERTLEDFRRYLGQRLMATGQLDGEIDADGRIRPPRITDPEALADMTVDELYEMAREIDLEGRSSMRKAELVDALASG